MSITDYFTPDPFPWIPDPWTPDPYALKPFACFARFWSTYLFEIVLLTALGGTTVPGLDYKGLLDWVPVGDGLVLPWVQPILNIILISNYLNKGIICKWKIS